MEVITSQEKCLSDDAFVRSAELANGFGIPRTKDVWKGTVYTAEVSEEFGFLARSGTNRDVERAR